MSDMQYSALTDEAVVKLIQNGENDALDYIIYKYKNTAKIKARAYFLIGADKEDIIQEGMIGLYKAIRDYDSNKSPVFYKFAELCIQRQIFTAIKTAARRKHIPLNKYISLDSTFETDGDDKETSYLEVFTANGITNPEDIFIGKEDKNYIESAIQKALSPLEKNVLAMFMDGKSYGEIAAILQKSEKSVDNSLQRVRKKVSRIMSER